MRITNKHSFLKKQTRNVGVVLLLLFGSTNVTAADFEVNTEVTKETKSSEQEKREITGVVKDETGAPLIGASVIVKNTKLGAVTDFDGNFALTGVKSGDILEFTYIGYKPISVKIDTQSHYAIKLMPDAESLDEVVVVGFGTQKKANLTGAVASIGAEKIANRPVTSLASSLAGVTPGVTITQSGAQPGASQGDIKIRGVGTWGTSTPLVLVDGVASSMDNVIPSQIENISVLKDAASAAIYGSRAANGVILITTKKGNKGRVQVSYDGNFGIQNAVRNPKMASSYEFAILENQYFINDGQPAKNSPEKLERLRLGTGNPDEDEANTDWYDALLKTGFQQMHQASISGGGDTFTYFSTFGYTNQNGIIDNTSFQRYNIRLNTVTDITKWFKLGMNLSFQTGKKLEPSGGASDAYRRIGRSLPYLPVKYSDGSWSYSTSPTNPVRRTTKDYGMVKNRSDITTMQITPEVKIIDGLIFRGLLGYESSVTTNKKLSSIVKYGSLVEVSRSKIENKWEQWRNLTSNATITYDKAFGEHYITLLGGGSLETMKYEFTNSGRYDLPEGFNETNMGDSGTAFAEGNSTYNSLAGLFGRINYAFAGRYLFEANIRYDGSSKFGRGHRWGTFPSVSAGWRISEEAFFEPLKETIQNLKLRGSWGQLGNQNINSYQFLSTINSGGTYVFDDKILPGYKENTMAYPNITWETAENVNIGLDVTLLRQRLNLEFDWYNRTTKDILLALKAPSMLGIGAPLSNAGKVRNRGWEISATWNDKIGNDFTYFINANIGDVKNKIIDLKGYKSSTDDLTTRIEGQPIDAIFGYKTLGIAYNQELYDKHKDVMKTYNANWTIGDIIIEDEDGDEKITSNDKKVIGSSIPRYTYGITLGGAYKDIDFSFFFQGVGKRDGYVTNEAITPLGSSNSARREHYTDSFDPLNPRSDAFYPRMSAKGNSYNYENFSHWVQDASFFRLKNIQIGYTFKIDKIQKLRTYFSADNIFTVTDFRSFDPEVPVGSRSQYPNVRTFSLGLNLIF